VTGLEINNSNDSHSECFVGMDKLQTISRYQSADQMTINSIIPRRSSVGSLDGIADVLTIALPDVGDHFAVVVSDWSRVRSIRSLLCATVVHLVCSINAVNHAEK